MWTAKGSTATVAPQRVAPPRPARPQRGRSTSCCDHVVPADRLGTHETPAAVPAGRTTRQTRLRSPPTDPPPADRLREPPAPQHARPDTSRCNVAGQRKVTKTTHDRLWGHDPIRFFPPHAAYSAAVRAGQAGRQ